MKVILPIKLNVYEGTCTRSSSATYYNSSGILTTALTDVVRITHDPKTLVKLGPLIETSATNYLVYSEDFSNTSWIKTGVAVVGSYASSPTTAITATQLAETVVNSKHSVSQTYNTTNLGIYSFSVYAKRETRSILRINHPISGYCEYNLLNSTLTSAGTFIKTFIEPGISDWHRCGFTVDLSEPFTNLTFELNLVSAGTTSYLGTASSGLLIFGAQLEQYVGVSSYIKTTSASTTRSADVFNSTTSGLYYTNVPETDYPTWSSLTNYSVGTYVVYNHKIYKSALSGTNNNPETSTGYWTYVSYTNRWGFSDLYSNKYTLSNTDELNIVLQVNNRLDSIAVLNTINATSLSVRMVKNGELVYNYQKSQAILDNSINLFDLPPYTNVVLTICLTGITGVGCKKIVFGLHEYIGDVQTGVNIDQINNSILERDAFGIATYQQKKNIGNLQKRLFLRKEDVRASIYVRDNLNAEPAAWCGLETTDTQEYYQPLVLLGFYKKFALQLDNSESATIDLELEEI